MFVIDFFIAAHDTDRYNCSDRLASFYYKGRGLQFGSVGCLLFNHTSNEHEKQSSGTYGVQICALKSVFMFHAVMFME